jgi:translation initiation factor IF-3
LAHKDLGFNLLTRLEEDLKDLVDMDSKPRSEGRTIYMIVSPKKDIEKIMEQKKLNTEEEETNKE